MRVAGSVLVLLAFGGVLTVADDPRHVGEIVSVASIFVTGVMLLAASLNPRVQRTRVPRFARWRSPLTLHPLGEGLRRSGERPK